MARANIERDNEVLRLWADKLSGSQIADTLGISRATVLGIVHRAKQRGENVEARSTRAGPASVSIKEKIQTNTERQAKIVATAPAVYEPAPADALSFDQLVFKSCRYPVSEVDFADHRFCGAQRQPGSSYCTAHHRLSYVSRREYLKQRAARRASNPHQKGIRHADFAY